MAIEDEDFSTSGSTTPAAKAVAVTPADVDLAQRTRAIYTGTTGDLVVKMADGDNSVIFRSVAAGSILPIRVTQIMAATTATDIVALF